MKGPLFPTFQRYFSTGLVVLLPIAASVWLIIWLYGWLESIVLPIFPTEKLLPWAKTLIGLVILITGITLLGLLAQNVVGKWLVRLVDLFMAKVPLASNVYNFVKGLVENLAIMQSGYFKKVVMIEYPRPGIWSLGFIARPLQGAIQTAIEGDRTAVFIPTSPNPTSGFIVVVYANEVVPLDITPEEALKFIMSGGVLMPGVNFMDNTGHT
jgi:uncharacterized membrane protein